MSAGRSGDAALQGDLPDREVLAGAAQVLSLLVAGADGDAVAARP